MPLVPAQTDISAPIQAAATYRPARAASPGFRVNTGTLQQGVQRLADANQAQQVEAAPFVRAAGAAGYIGEAVSRAGSIIGALAEKRLQARERKATLEAATSMDLAEASLREWQARNEVSTATWEAKAAEVADEVIAKHSDDGRLSKSAREELALRMVTWGKKLVLTARTGAASTDFRVARNAESERINGLIGMGRFAEARTEIDTAEASGRHYPHEVIGMRNQLGISEQRYAEQSFSAELSLLSQARRWGDARAFVESAQPPPGTPDDQWSSVKDRAMRGIEASAQRDEASVLMDTDPRKLQGKLALQTSFPALSAAERAELARQAGEARERAADRQLQDALAEVEAMPRNAISDQVKTPTDQMTPRHQLMLQQKVAYETGKAEMNDPDDYVAQWNAIDRYDPATDPTGVRAAQAAMAIDIRFSGALAAQLKERLQARRDVPEAPDLAAAKAQIVESAKAASMVPVTADGHAVTRKARTIGSYTVHGETMLGIDWLNPDSTYEVKENDGKPVPLTRLDPRKKAEYDQRAMSVNQALERLWQASPDRWERDPGAWQREVRRLAQQKSLPLVPAATLWPVGSYEDALKLKP